MALHSALTGAELHEPKGASTAVVNTTYIANGAGSGNWYKIYTQGWEDWDNTGGAQSPVAGVFTDLTNNGLGTGSTTTYTLPSVTGGLWNTTTNSLVLSELTIGDTVDIEIDCSVTTGAINEDITLALDLAHGTGSEYQIIMNQVSYRTAGTYRFTTFHSFYIPNATVRDNPGKIAIKFVGTSTVTVDNFYIRVIPRNPILGA